MNTVQKMLDSHLDHRFQSEFYPSSECPCYCPVWLHAIATIYCCANQHVYKVTPHYSFVTTL